MAKKYKVCKNDGTLVSTDLKECPVCSENKFVDKYKGVAIVFDAKKSHVAEKLSVKNNGIYALKY